MSAQNKLFEGKVREIYNTGEDERTLLIVTTDRISAYDVIMPTAISDKGKILNAISEFWFDYLEKTMGDEIKTHLITSDIDEFPMPFRGDVSLKGRGMLVKKLKMLPFECIVRGYISGSAWETYSADGTVCGERMAPGLLESSKFSSPVYTPSTKAEEGHDINVSYDYTVEILGRELAEKVRDMTVKIYTVCADYAASRGVIIADTKFEFGLDENGELVLGDEVLTPDSSRFWSAAEFKPGKSQPSYDKQYLRDWLSDNGHRGISPGPELPEEVVKATRDKYLEVYKLLQGSDLTIE